MKKILLGGIAIVAIAVATALNVNVKSNDSGLSELGIRNVEALAVKQVPCWRIDGGGIGFIRDCSGCTIIPFTTAGSLGTCNT